MSEPEATRARVAGLWQKAARERQRAARAAELAESYEESVLRASPRLRDLRARMATVHRQAEQRHLTAAGLQALHATRLQSWLDSQRQRTEPPSFTTAIGAQLGRSSVLVTLMDGRCRVVIASASDAAARAAYDAEFVGGEGPFTEAAGTGETVLVSGQNLDRRWPDYSSAVRAVGVESVLAVPLRQPGGCVGALCVFDGRSGIGTGLVRTTELLAEALARAVLDGAPVAETGADDPLRLFDEVDFQDVVHQAAGMVSVQQACAVDDALLLLKARAFSEGTRVEDIARRIVSGVQRLD